MIELKIHQIKGNEAAENTPNQGLWHLVVVMAWKDTVAAGAAETALWQISG
jgi:hypothetical protein